MSQPAIIKLPEYKTISLPAENFPELLGKLLFDKYPQQVSVAPPTFKTDYHWQLVNLGWVGHIPLTDDFYLALMPKVPIKNLFRMLEYAYRLKSFTLLDGTIQNDSLNDLYENLASILAKRVLGRGRKGFYRAYISEHDRLPYVRGQVDLNHALVKPWDVALACHFQEHTADIEDNQILTWTLFRVARSGVCSERVLPTVRRAYRSLQSRTQLTPFDPEACAGRLYNRLNDDYKPLHGLARFFLEQSGPSHQIGERTMIPFLVDMARLYELFVAEWLRLHLPPPLRLRTQYKVTLDNASSLHFAIDLMIEEAATGRVLCVLDTKYKAPNSTPSSSDVQQVIAYAQNLGAPESILIYPVTLSQPLNIFSRNIRIRSLTFALDGDLEEAGQAFITDLNQGIVPA